jgi:hypothetical protein
MMDDLLSVLILNVGPLKVLPKIVKIIYVLTYLCQYTEQIG